MLLPNECLLDFVGNGTVYLQEGNFWTGMSRYCKAPIIDMSEFINNRNSIEFNFDVDIIGVGTVLDRSIRDGNPPFEPNLATFYQ